MVIKTVHDKQNTDIMHHSELKMPKNINLEKWEDVGYHWSGEIIPQALPRFAAIVPKQYQHKAIALSFKLYRDGQLLTLVMDFVGQVWVMCQRCLQPLAIDITHDISIKILENDEQIGLVNEDDDYLMLNELLETSSAKPKDTRLLPIATLIEDELLLEVPLSAKHQDCELAVDSVGTIVEEKADNPFLVLESLKGKL